MPRRDTYVPTHRNAPSEPGLKQGLRRSFVLSGVAVAVTGLTIGSGVVTMNQAPAETAAGPFAAATLQQDSDPVLSEPIAPRERQASRSQRRTSPADKKAADKKAAAQQRAAQKAQQKRREPAREDVPTDPRAVARSLLGDYGFSESEFGCLDALYVSESDWDPRADNPYSSAYGIPQALTGGTHDLPADYMTNPVSQIKWGLEYIRDSYGTPCAAWEFKQSNDWY